MPPEVAPESLTATGCVRMCGIAGIYSRGDIPVPTPRLLALRDDQVHRGPDASGLHSGPHIGLAFNRLAIIYLSPAAKQPMDIHGDAAPIDIKVEVTNNR